MAKREIRANLIFLGYPWKTYRAHWEKAVTELHKWSPLHFLAIGRQPGQPAAQLLTHILSSIDQSSAAFFDASGGNPNVALEYGYARATLEEKEIYLFRDENATSAVGPGSPIMSDLAGAIANQYALNDSRLKDTLKGIATAHPYTKNFERFCRQRKYKGGPRRFLVRILRQLDDKDSILRRELLDSVMHESGKSEAFILRYLRELHQAGLIAISAGNNTSCRVKISG